MAAEQKMGEWIRQIELESLWNRSKRVKWELRPDVNILSGVNGVGKSTILNHIITQLRHLNDTQRINSVPGVRLVFEPADATGVRFDVVRSFDNALIPASIVSKIELGENVRSELDWRLYKLQRAYLAYQVKVGNLMIEALTSGRPDAQTEALAVAGAKTQFQNLVDDLFQDTGKCIDRSNNELRFLQNGDVLTPYSLSSGEKQILVIMLTVLLQEGEASVLLLDEPEVSLHVEWQERLIDIIRTMNPHTQVILTTHSPAVVMNGWADAVTEVSDILI